MEAEYHAKFVVEGQPIAISYLRFSNPDQENGDSIRRQIEISEEWARTHGYVLDDSLRMEDHGLSAFHGKHVTKGALGQFLEKVKAGQIPQGSVLLVESLDRLSREELTEALEQFLAIIRNGIKIVTLADNAREYTKETINSNMGDLFVGLSIMVRAHEESKMKSFRLSKAWEAKRAEAINGGKKLTGKCPAWLVLHQDKTYYEELEERVAIIQRIYRERLSAKGIQRITRDLNQDPTIAWKPKSPRKANKGQEGWWPSYVTKILHNREVLGEYQLYKKVNGKRQPIGPPIRNYFPAIITEEDFYRVQEQFKSNKVQSADGRFIGQGGQVGPVSNLFTHIARCGYCGSTLQYVNKGKWRYLACGSALRRAGCDYLSIPYKEIEDVVLKYCKGLNPAEILPGREEAENLMRALIGRLSATRGKLENTKQYVLNVRDSIRRTKSPAVREELDGDLDALLKERTFLEKQYSTLQREFQAGAKVDQDAKERLSSLRELFDAMGTLQGLDLIDLRLRLRQEIRRLIKRIDVYPEGNPRYTQEWMDEQLKSTAALRPSESFLEKHKKSLQQMVKNSKEHLELTVWFVAGSVQTLQPRQSLSRQGELDVEAGVYRDYYGTDDNEVYFELPVAKPTGK
ncbi:MAG: recombinase family protein [Syntrophobacteraceae bacterium]|jgi:DNA invertase Pin-like site-specific DNA recombinase